jgi:hypothetical protein
MLLRHYHESINETKANLPLWYQDLKNLYLMIWTGEEGDTDIICEFLAQHKMDPSFLPTLEYFSKYISQYDNPHDLSRVETKHLFLDAYWVSARKEFLDLKNAINNLMTEAKQPFSDVYSDILYGVFNFSNQWVLKTLTVLSSLTTVTATKKAPEKKQATNTFDSIEKVQLFLASQDVIRIHIDSFPTGTGNQASSMNMMKRLRILGYKGKFECIYFTKSDGSNKKKIANLFGFNQDFPAIFYDEKSNSEFIDGCIHLNYLYNKHKQYLLTLTGGELSFLKDAFSSGRLSEKVYIKVARKFGLHKDDLIFNTNSFIRMQCWFGHRPNENAPAAEILMSGNVFWSPNVNEEVPAISKKFITVPVETLDDAFAYVNHDPMGKELAVKSKGLLTYMHGLKEMKFHAMPIYGRTLLPAGKNPEQNDSTIFYQNIFKFIFGARLAQMREGSSHLTMKPLILPVFYNYTDEIKSINTIIQHNDWGTDRNLAELFRLGPLNTHLDLAKHFKIADLNDASSIHVINSLKPGEILLLSMGELPQILFNGLYVTGSDSIIAHVYEGENTFNSITSVSNKPFLRAGDWKLMNYGYEPRDNILHDSFKKYDTTTDFDEMVLWVAEFLISSRDPQSSISKYFKWLYAQSQSIQNDRLMLLMIKTITELEKNKLWPTNTIQKADTWPLSPVQQDSQFFAQMSYSFIDSVLAQLAPEEKAALANAINTQSCPNTSPAEFLIPHHMFNCAHGFFKLPGTQQCLPQPNVTHPATLDVSRL